MEEIQREIIEMKYIKFYNDMSLSDLIEHLESLKFVFNYRNRIINETSNKEESKKIKRTFNGRNCTIRRCWGPCGKTFTPSNGRQLICKFCLNQMSSHREISHWTELREKEGWVKYGPNKTI